MYMPEILLREEKMIAQIIIYINIFIIGTVMGSFFTLATYRIPLKQDILYTRSYCPKCNNKLKFLDLIPILSYIFLKGKCRYCHEKIKPRYIIIEFFSGLFYLLFVVSLKIDFLNIQVEQIAQLIYGTFMISAFFIVGGIAKETRKISKGTLLFGVIIQTIYIIYLYILKFNIYRYIIYWVALLLMFIIQAFIKDSKNKKIIDLMIIMLFSVIATNELVFLTSLIFTSIIYILNKIFKGKNETNIVFYFSFLNILFLIIYNFV